MAALPRVFLSYSTLDKELAGSVKDCLEAMGFDVFLAHSTLVVSEEWRTTIKQELTSREIFIVLLTPNAKSSDWVDQEIGIAIGLKKTVIPLQAPTPPYGFVGDFHAVPINPNDPWECMGDVTRGIVAKHPTTREPFRKGILRRLCDATSFHEARTSIQILQHLKPPLSRRERQVIYVASQKNGQIGGFSEVRRFVAELDKEFGKSKSGA